MCQYPWIITTNVENPHSISFKLCSLDMHWIYFITLCLAGKSVSVSASLLDAISWTVSCLDWFLPELFSETRWCWLYTLLIYETQQMSLQILRNTWGTFFSRYLVPRKLIKIPFQCKIVCCTFILRTLTVMLSSCSCTFDAQAQALIWANWSAGLPPVRSP